MNRSLEPLSRTESAVSAHPETIRIFVIARQDIYVDGLIRVISDHPNHHIIACMQPGKDCFDQFCANPVDILLVEKSVIDQCLQDTPLEELFKDFQSQFPDLRIIVFGHDIPDTFVRKMIRAGVHGFIDSNMAQGLLATAIREIYNGGYWVGRKALEQLIYSAVEMERIVEQGIRDKIDSIQDTLTKRESDVLQRVLEGMSTKEIANDLCLSEQSVKLHLGRLFRKFEVSNRSQLILMAFKRVCPVTNMIQLFRKSLDKRRQLEGHAPGSDDPLANIN